MVLDLSTASPTKPGSQIFRTFLWTRTLQPLLQKLFNWLTAQKAKTFAKIPGPNPIFPLGNALDFASTPTWKVLGNYAQEYGNITRFWMLFGPCIALNDPQLIKQVLSEDGSNKNSKARESRCPVHNNPIYKFYKNQPRKALRPMLTDTNPFEAAVTDEPWREIKHNHPFSMDYFNDWLASQVAPLLTFVETRASELVSASQEDKLPAFDTIQKLTFDGFSLATVGQVFPDKVFQQFNIMCQTGTRRMTRSTLATWLIPQKPWDRTYARVSRAWFQLFDEVVAQKHITENSLLDWVKREGGTNFDTQKLRNFCAGVYPGGAISTPSGITSALHLLGQHPEVKASLRLELEKLFAEPLTPERLEDCTRLDQVVRESLRLWPAVPLFLRTVNQGGAELAEYSIPAQTPIFMSNWSLQRTSDHWSDPEVFNPDRWDAETCDQNDWGSDYFFPFGRGNRACIGQYFARYFMKLTLAVLLAKFEVTFGDQPHDQEFFFGVAVPRQLKAKFDLYTR